MRARVVHYTLDSSVLNRRLPEIAVVPRGGGSGRLLVLLHGRHDPGPLHWFVSEIPGPQSMLNDAFFAGLARLGPSAPGAFDDAEDYTRNDIFTEAPRLKGIPVWLDNGTRDPFRDADAKLARELHVVQHFWPGGHTGSYWHAHMAQYLRFYESACRMRPKRSAAT